MQKFNNYIEDLARIKLHIDNDLEQYAAELDTTPAQLQTDYARCKDIADKLGIVELKMLWYLAAYWGGKKTGVFRLLKFLKTRYEKQEAIYFAELITESAPPCHLGENLRALRKKHNLTQASVASYLKMSISAYGHYELDQRAPEPKTLLRLADFFGVTVDYLLRGTEDEQ